ncbi:MAG: hypothetical protein A2Z97_08555 [Bdellovibrionales bacterium GWB1_52_6]|nr:MAG: hypothetical protein A2Z97_08555 [Bdellovibrionales bacterium GWB1_52_6]
MKKCRMAALAILLLPACQCSTNANKAATVAVDPGTFDSPTEVIIESTQAKETAETFSVTVNTEGPGGFTRAKSETVVTADKTPPKKGIALTLPIPAEIKTDLKASKELYVFVEYFYNGVHETHDSFQAVPIQKQTSDSVLITLEPSAFTNLRNKTGTYEAVVVLASGPKK